MDNGEEEALVHRVVFVGGAMPTVAPLPFVARFLETSVCRQLSWGCWHGLFWLGIRRMAVVGSIPNE